MKRSFMRSRNDAKLCLAAGPYLRRPLHTPLTQRRRIEATVLRISISNNALLGAGLGRGDLVCQLDPIA